MPPGYDSDRYDQAVYEGGVVTQDPVIDSLRGPDGQPTGKVGDSITIGGANFTGISGASAVKFGTTNAQSYAFVSDGQLTAVVPSMSTGPTTVTVTVNAVTSAPFAFTVRSTQPPANLTFSPSSGAVGSLLHVNGTNLATTTAVKMGGLDAPYAVSGGDSVYSGTHLDITVPSLGNGNYTITVWNPDSDVNGTSTGSQYQVTGGGGGWVPPPQFPAGLQHSFNYGGATIQLPDLRTQFGERLGSFEDRSNMRGGFMSATGVISEALYNANTSIFRAGATWVVQDAASKEFVFGGELKKPETAGGQAVLAAEGWGYGTEKLVERFLLANMDVEQWAPADSDPFPTEGTDPQGNPKYKWAGYNRISGEIRTNAIVFQVNHGTMFHRNDNNTTGRPPAAGNDWPSTPFMFWAPTSPLKWIHFDVHRHGDEQNCYDIQLVGTPTGPTGTLSVLRYWNLGATATTTVDYQIPGSYDCIGLRLVRTKDTSADRIGVEQKGADGKPRRDKGAEHLVVVIDNLQVGSIATSTTYTATQAFQEIFRRMGVTSTNVYSTNVNVLPYDAAKVTLSSIADDMATLMGWNWRITSDANGNPLGEAAPIGNTTYYVNLPQTPVEPLPQPVYNVVQYNYRYGGGYEGLGTVRANPDPAPGEDWVYPLTLDEPPILSIATQFAQMVANYVSKQWYSGSATLYEVRTASGGGGTALHGAVVKPGDRLVLERSHNVHVIADEVSHTDDGALTEVSFADTRAQVDKWLAQRQRRMNRGLSADAATLALLDHGPPAAPTLNSPIFYETESKKGERIYNAHLTWERVTEDIYGEGTAVLRYHVKARPYDKTTDNYIAKGKGGGWTRQTVHASREHDQVPEPSDPPVEATLKNLDRPHQWGWEIYVRAEDVLGEFSDWSNPQRGVPGAYQVPQPTITYVNVDPGDVEVRWDSKEDPDDTGVDPGAPGAPKAPDPRIAYAQVQLWISQNPSFTNTNTGPQAGPRNLTYLMREDKRHEGEHMLFHWDVNEYRKRVNYLDAQGLYHDPVDNRGFTVRVRNVDAFGQKSLWSTDANARIHGAPTPAPPNQTFYMWHGPDGPKLRCRLDYNEPYLKQFQDDVNHTADIRAVVFRLEMCDLTAKGNPRFLGTPPIPVYTKQHDQTDAQNPVMRLDIRKKVSPITEVIDPKDNDDDFTGEWFSVKKGLWYRAGARLVDTKGRFGAWSAWSGPKCTISSHPNFNEGYGKQAHLPGQKMLNPPGGKVTNGIESIASWSNVKGTLKGVVVRWDWPLTQEGDRDSAVSGFQVNLSTSNAVDINGTFTTPLLPDTGGMVTDAQVRGTHRRFDQDEFTWPTDGTGALKPVYAQVRSTDVDGNYSDWNTSLTTATPGNVTGPSKPGTNPPDIDNIAQFAADIRPVVIVSSLPTDYTKFPAGSYVLLTVAGGNNPDTYDPDTGTYDVFPPYTLYRSTGSGWSAAIRSSSVVGTLVAGQISAGAIRGYHIKANQISANKLATDLAFVGTLTLYDDAQGKGALLKSRPSGARIEIDGTPGTVGPDVLRFYNADAVTDVTAYTLLRGRKTGGVGNVHHHVSVEHGNLLFGDSFLVGDPPSVAGDYPGTIEFATVTAATAPPTAGHARLFFNGTALRLYIAGETAAHIIQMS